ncbi:MAG: thioesterase family protein [Pseudomonadales bacterium]|nr:thioesterase family protein [Pseudomonadales bacterium]
MSKSSMLERGSQRNDYGYFVPLTTRWHDNDIYGHVNNVVYYSYFDTTANSFLINEGGLDIHMSDVIGVVVSSHCDFFSSIAYPDELEGGLRVGKLGNSSVTYELAIFKRGESSAVAAGSFTHVFVERETQRPRPIPDRIRGALQKLKV